MKVEGKGERVGKKIPMTGGARGKRRKKRRKGDNR